MIAKIAENKATSSVPRLKTDYDETIRSELQKELGLSNINEVPKLEKVVVSIGLGKAKDDKKLIEVANNTLRKITGQQPINTLARQSIASFKLREGNVIGLKVTLRGYKMYEFVDRLINIILPRLRDFRGVSSQSFDTQGNYSIGFRDQSVFPELSYDEYSNAHGIQVTFIINSAKAEHTRSLLTKFGMPFQKEEKR